MDPISSSKISFITIDVNDMSSAETFWSAALGATSSGSESFKKLTIPGTAIEIFLQLVPEAKSSKNRVHFDLTSSDLDAESTRLQQLGAKIIRPAATEGFRFIVFEDPFGNEFCLLSS